MPKASERAPRALTSAWRSGVPQEATALYARWWQLESWLRELVYVELQAKHGREWETLIAKATERHWGSDRKYSYMDTPDASSRLAYLDVGNLVDVIEDQWDVVSYALLGDLAVWQARMAELNKIRRRIAHCRRPHPDDLGRVEQTLRDIDAGAHRALSAFNRPSWLWAPEDHPDPVIQALRGGHLEHLRKHCERNYGIEFRVHYSRRPWATSPPENGSITGTPGYIWHVVWQLTQGGPGDARKLWNELSPEHHNLVIFLLADRFTFEMTFSALHDPDVLAETIKVMFDRVVASRRPPIGYREPERLLGDDDWERFHQGLDWRVQIGSAWNVIDDEAPVSVFSA